MKHVGRRTEPKDVASQEQLGDLAIIYPNGGSAGSPANAALNTRYVESSPFPGYSLIVRPEFLYGGEWHTAEPLAIGSTAAGCACSQVGNSIILRTAVTNIIYCNAGYINSSVPGTVTSGALPVRVLVWKAKGVA